MPETTPPNSDSPKGQASPEATPSPVEAKPSPTADPVQSPPPKPKQRALTFAAVIGVLAVILILLNLIPFDKLSKEITEGNETPVETFAPHYFKTPVYDEDFTQDSVYMDLERNLHYSVNGVTVEITDNAEEEGEVCELFEAFRTAVVSGDCDAYNALFTDEYIEKKGKAEFSPQKLYNLTVTVISSEFLKDGDANGLYQGATVTYCTVEYCIKDNDGTFRRDFYRDGDFKTQIFEILDYNGSTKISQISTPRENNETEKEGLPIMFYIWIAMIVLAIVAEVMSTALVAVWFIPGAVISLVLALLEVNVYAQVITYVVSALILIIVFKFILKLSGKKKSPTPTNADRIIGECGIVTEEINNIASTGEVKIDGKRWTARSEKNGVSIAEGTLVKILRIEGVKLICEPANDESDK